MVHKVLEGFNLNRAVVYIDDTVVYGKDEKPFLHLDRMAKFNVRLKSSKCLFGMTSVEFVGYIFDENGVHLSKKRVQRIRDLPIPTSVSAVRSFVGTVNYFRDFIPLLSSYLQPLTELTIKRNLEENGFEMTERFLRVKVQVMGHITRVLINASDPLILYTDASTRVIGGVLMQVQGGRERPYVFVSHTRSARAPALGVPFSDRAHPWSPKCGSRWTHKGLPHGFEESKSICAILLQG
jgi:hypothetical protein